MQKCPGGDVCRMHPKPRAERLRCAADTSGGGVVGDAPRDDQMRGYADGLGWVARADDAQACDSVRLLMAIAWLRGHTSSTAYYSIVITPPAPRRGECTLKLLRPPRGISGIGYRYSVADAPADAPPLQIQ